MKHTTEKSFIAQQGTKKLVIEERFLVNSKVGSLLKKLDKAGFSTVEGGDGTDLRKLDNSTYRLEMRTFVGGNTFYIDFTEQKAKKKV